MIGIQAIYICMYQINIKSKFKLNLFVCIQAPMEPVRVDRELASNERRHFVTVLTIQYIMDFLLI